ncbi:MAG TPA: hypothetical protein VHA73_05740 [Acidimicrobiales bacterium]|jgi:hypothetical protein|nr:hypothetical protein [Acidimicrobiales bacterium]
MAAPEYVPTSPSDAPRLVWVSTPRRPEPWLADRPGDFPRDAQPRGDRLGSPGPDLGYAYKLLGLFADKLHLADGEHRRDAEAGAVQIAMKRSSLFGRAPVVHDLTVAFTVWGFLDESPDDELVETRRQLFEGAGHHNSYVVQRTIADTVPEQTLCQTPAAIASAHATNWKSLLDLDAARRVGH